MIFPRLVWGVPAETIARLRAENVELRAALRHLTERLNEARIKVATLRRDSAVRGTGKRP